MLKFLTQEYKTVVIGGIIIYLLSFYNDISTVLLLSSIR